jgi:hypothetical protein
MKRSDRNARNGTNCADSGTGSIPKDAQGHVLVQDAYPLFFKLQHIIAMVFAALSFVKISHLASGWNVSPAKTSSMQEQEDVGRGQHHEQLQILHSNMLNAEKEATGTNRSVNASRWWLESVLAVDRHLVAVGAPEDIRAYTLSEVQRVALHHFPWNELLIDRELLRQVAPALATRMLVHDEIRNCCASDRCLHDQVSTVMIFQELNMTGAARAHLQAVKAAVGASSGNTTCRGMAWQLDRLVAPLDIHFPSGYDHLVNVTSEPVFWSSSQLPLVRHVEQHSDLIIAELAPICSSKEISAPAQSVQHFGSETVVKDLALGSWKSLPLLNHGVWNLSACETLTPRTCALLKSRPELQGAMRSASASDTDIIVQFTFVSVYRLQSKSRIHRHVGTQWRLNTHLGVVTPPGAKIRVWNESREWEVGKAFAFLDAAEHDVVHAGETARCVLNIVSWHPAVLERRTSDPVFAQHFAF